MRASEAGTAGQSTSATSSSARDASVLDDDAGVAPLVMPECHNGQWILAPQFTLSERVDYVADRTSFPSLTIFSSQGTPCGTARDRATCEADLRFATDSGRHLITSTGDNVRLWFVPAAMNLLGPIDNAAEAIWVILVSGYEVPCGVTATAADGGIVLSGITEPFNPCLKENMDAGPPRSVSALVDRNGTFTPLWLDGGVFGGCMIPF